MTAPGIAQQPPTSAWSMYRAIVGIGVLCALVIVAVYQATAERIRDNQARFLAAAVAQVLPQAQVTISVTMTDSGDLAEADEPGALPVFLGHDGAGKLAGAVVTAEGMGYQDNIRLIYAYSFDARTITGFKILDSKETPGLGDRVEKEPHFLANFEALSARLTPDGDALLHRIVTVKQGEKTEPWQIDGITGATITSEAIGSIIDASANTWVPVLADGAGAFGIHATGEAP